MYKKQSIWLSSDCVSKSLQNASIPWIWAADNKKKLSVTTVTVKIWSFICMVYMDFWGYAYTNFKHCICNTNEHPSLSFRILLLKVSYAHIHNNKVIHNLFQLIQDAFIIVEVLKTRNGYLTTTHCYHFYSDVSISTELGVNNLYVCTTLFWHNWNCNK
jgi:hypothetical protein